MEAKEVRNLMEAYASVYEGYGKKKKKMHDCASHVKHEEYGLGDCIKEMHTLDEEGNVTHYDVQFEHGIVENVPASELEVLISEVHEHFVNDEKNAEVIEEKEKEVETDLFDYLLEYLVAEGYADTNKAALAIMANMSEEWKQSIVEQMTVNVADVKGGTQAAKNAQAGMKDKSGNPMYKPGVGVGPDFKLKGV